MADLTGKTALVTGAGAGLGRAAAVALAKEGAKVAVTELPHRLDLARETVEQVRAVGSDGVALPLNVLELPTIGETVGKAAEFGGGLDILVNNAGVNIRRDAFDVSEADWDGVVDVNLKGVFFVAQAAGRLMRDRSPSGGCIINISSIMGLNGYFQRSAYCSSKAGVVNLTKVLAIEWAPFKIRVNAVCPGFVATELTVPYFEKEPAIYQDILDRTLLGRLGNPEEVASAIVYLASPGASWVTGHALAVDGGWTAI
jgi:2-deoxy-D-gluconate 3-dehydrogenase